MPCGPRAACSTHHRFAKLCLGMRRSPPHSSHSEKNKSRPAKGRKGKTASMTDHAVIVPSAGRTLGSYLYDPKFRGIFFQILTLIVVAVVGWWIFDNTPDTMKRTNPPSGYAFLNGRASLHLDPSLPKQPRDS